MKTLDAQIKKIFEKADHSDWEELRFGDFALNISEHIEPSETDAETYVGLDHLDSDSIHIRRKGVPSDVKGIKLKVYKGDVIFGKRRAYQRKAAVADFDGICSAHAMVIRANPEKIAPRFFPFFLHSNVFMSRAVEISEGSLSPTIKWKTLSEQKFRLPPYPIQEKIADLLWLADELEEKHRLAYDKFLQVRLAYLIESFSKISHKFVPLGDLPIQTINGLWKSDEPETVMVKVMRSTEFSKFGEIDLSKLEPMPVSKKKYARSKLLPGDIIVERSGGGPEQPVGRVCYFDISNDEFSFSNFTSSIRVNDAEVLNAKYLFYFLETFYERGLTERIQKQTTGIRNLNYDMYLMTKVPLPDINEQKALVSQVDEIENNRRSLYTQIEQTRGLRNTLLNRIFA